MVLPLFHGTPMLISLHVYMLYIGIASKVEPSTLANVRKHWLKDTYNFQQH